MSFFQFICLSSCACSSSPRVMLLGAGVCMCGVLCLLSFFGTVRWGDDSQDPGTPAVNQVSSSGVFKELRGRRLASEYCHFHEWLSVCKLSSLEPTTCPLFMIYFLACFPFHQPAMLPAPLSEPLEIVPVLGQNGDLSHPPVPHSAFVLRASTSDYGKPPPVFQFMPSKLSNSHLCKCFHCSVLLT